MPGITVEYKNWRCEITNVNDLPRRVLIGLVVAITFIIIGIILVTRKPNNPCDIDSVGSFSCDSTGCSYDCSDAQWTSACSSYYGCSSEQCVKETQAGGSCYERKEPIGFIIGGIICLLTGLIALVYAIHSCTEQQNTGERKKLPSTTDVNDRSHTSQNVKASP